MVADTTSTTARALFSWRVTQAVVPSVVMNSGSRSWDTEAPGPKIRTPLARSSSIRASKAPKPAVATVAEPTPPERSTTLIDPSGSTVYSSSGSPSLATRTRSPSGVKVTMSGREPTSTDPSLARVVVS